MYGNRRGPLETDELDERLLAALRRNSRESFVELSRVLDTSEGTVRTRLKKLVDGGAIRAFTIRTAMKNVKAIIEIKTETNVNTQDISSRISRIRGVEQVFEVSGDWDVMAVVETSSTAELNDVIEHIRRIPRTNTTQTRLILKEI